MGSARTGTADKNPSFARIAAAVALLCMPVSSSRRTPRRAGVPSRLTQTTSGGMVLGGKLRCTFRNGDNVDQHGRWAMAHYYLVLTRACVAGSCAIFA
jgi:hypothetical protein